MKKILLALAIGVVSIILLNEIVYGIRYMVNPYSVLPKQASIDHQERMAKFEAFCKSQGEIIDKDNIIDDPDQHWTAGSCYKTVGEDAYEEDIMTFQTYTSPGYRGQAYVGSYHSSCAKACSHNDDDDGF